MRVRRPRREGYPPCATRDDEGSLLLVILFTIMITSVVLVMTATAIAGQTKTRASRDYAVALQAADVAFADALLRAHPRSATTESAFTDPAATGPLTSGTQSVAGTAVTWRWDATRVSALQWQIKVTATAAKVDRHFSATLTGSMVKSAMNSRSTGAVRYVAPEATDPYKVVWSISEYESID